MLRKSTIVVWTVLPAALVQLALAEEKPLATAQLIVLGASVEVAPAQITVPLGVSPEVQTVFCRGQVEPGPDLRVKASLRGPGLAAPVPLTARPGQPFTLRALTQIGTYTLADIRLEIDGRVLLSAEPDHVTIEVIEHDKERSDHETSSDSASSD